MPNTSPNFGQVLLLILAAALFACGNLLSLARLWWQSWAVRIAAKSLNYWGICLALAGLVWHGVSIRSAVPLEDNFETLTALAVLLAGLSLYFQRTKTITGLDWFIMPVVIALLIGAVVFSEARPGAYRTDTLWSWTHRISTFGGSAAFALAAAFGGIYLIASARLRRKSSLVGPNLGNLERLERKTQLATQLGFALLTLGMITGFFEIIHDGSNTALGAHPFASPKVILAVAVWVTYAMALHTPLTPAVRGRRAALLSILGFVLMLGAIVAVQFMPGGAH
jgi:ABC-type uncharacterized transport system permease subunit